MIIFQNIMAENFLNKLLKIITYDGRNVIGRLKCVDNLGNLYINETCEVFDKNEDFCLNFDIFKNNYENYFSFETEKNYYQIYSSCIVPKKEIKNIIISK
jgi:small nuclear ribonucleoprotein (snRNP)-like protein